MAPVKADRPSGPVNRSRPMRSWACLRHAAFVDITTNAKGNKI